MPNFSYKGRDKQGKLVNGDLEAANQSAVADLLMQRSIIPINIVEAKGGSGSASASINLGKLNQFFEKKIGLDELVIFARQMHSLSKSGIAILRAINGLAETTTSPQFGRVLTDVGQQLEKGRPLSSCLNAHPKIFNKLMVSIVHVGENTGKLDDAFMQIALYFENEMETQKRIKSAMRYPTFVLIAVGMALVLVNIFVIPTFKGMFEKFGADLPPMTKVLITTSDAFVNYWPLMIAVLGGMIYGAKYWVSTEKGDLWWARNKLKIPHVGSILERSILSRFCRSFSLMIAAGVPITSGLNLVSDAVDNNYMGKKIIDMRKGIEKGESMTRVANTSGMFTPLVMQMIAVGEETGRIDELLTDVSDYYDREVDYDLKNLTAKIEPIMTGLVAGIVLVLALGIFTPMWNMMSAIK